MKIGAINNREAQIKEHKSGKMKVFRSFYSTTLNKLFHMILLFIELFTCMYIL